MSEYQPSTNCLHAGYVPGSGEPPQHSHCPVHHLPVCHRGGHGALFDLEAEGYFYTRLQNPTNDQVAAKICALEGGHRRHAHLLRPGGKFLCHL